VEELGEPRRVHHQEIELALLRAHRVALLLGAAREGVDVEKTNEKINKVETNKTFFNIFLLLLFLKH
jgi:hypothetical protein